MNHRERIELTDSPLDCIVKMAEGNPGALNALMKMMDEAVAIDPDSAFGPLGPLFSLDGMGIYGSHIWMLWSNVCERSALKAETLFRSVQLGLMRDSEVTAAASTGRHSFDFDALLIGVQAVLPDFGRVQQEQAA